MTIYFIDDNDVSMNNEIEKTTGEAESQNGKMFEMFNIIYQLYVQIMLHILNSIM